MGTKQPKSPFCIQSRAATGPKSFLGTDRVLWTECRSPDSLSDGARVRRWGLQEVLGLDEATSVRPLRGVSALLGGGETQDPAHRHTKETTWGHNQQEGPRQNPTARHRGVRLPASRTVGHTSAISAPSMVPDYSRPTQTGGDRRQTSRPLPAPCRGELGAAL